MDQFKIVAIGTVCVLVGGTVVLLVAVWRRKRKRTRLLQRIVDHYLQSGDFNGLPFLNLMLEFKGSADLGRNLEVLLREQKVDALFHDQQLNAHIKRLPEEAAEIQLPKFQSQPGSAVLYPSSKTLEDVVHRSEYAGKPFTLRMALGKPQIAFQAFDLSVLEFYRNDPRYYYEHDDISGRISIKSEYFESKEMPAHDQVLLQSFGFCFDSDKNRSVAVFLRDLSGLSSQHQQIWHAKQLEGEFKLHPDFYRSMIIGDWYEGISVFDAFLEELHHINELCKLMGRVPLFRKEYREHDKPRGFGFLIRPTLKEFNDFVLQLDKILSDNIDVAFFGTDIDLLREETREGGKVEVIRKGTIQLLEEWLNKKLTTGQPELIDEAIRTLKKVRRLRQSPAHALNEDVFDKKFQQDQRELIKEAYEALSILRQAFAFHPTTAGYKVPEWLDTGTIWLE